MSIQEPMVQSEVNLQSALELKDTLDSRLNPIQPTGTLYNAVVNTVSEIISNEGASSSTAFLKELLSRIDYLRIENPQLHIVVLPRSSKDLASKDLALQDTQNPSITEKTSYLLASGALNSYLIASIGNAQIELLDHTFSAEFTRIEILEDDIAQIKGA